MALREQHESAPEADIFLQLDHGLGPITEVIRKSHLVYSESRDFFHQYRPYIAGGIARVLQFREGEVTTSLSIDGHQLAHRGGAIDWQIAQATPDNLTFRQLRVLNYGLTGYSYELDRQGSLRSSYRLDESEARFLAGEIRALTNNPLISEQARMLDARHKTLSQDLSDYIDNKDQISSLDRYNEHVEKQRAAIKHIGFAATRLYQPPEANLS